MIKDNRISNAYIQCGRIANPTEQEELKVLEQQEAELMEKLLH